ncbi:hypothetical protein RUND412_001023 [Rhizina undulata]
MSLFRQHLTRTKYLYLPAHAPSLTPPSMSLILFLLPLPTLPHRRYYSHNYNHNYPIPNPPNAPAADESAIPPKPPISGQIETVEINVLQGLTLQGHQREVIGSVLDLFQGRPTRGKMAYWRGDAVFNGGFVKAFGRDEVLAAWQMHSKVMKDITMVSHEVVKVEDTSYEMELVQKYTLKGVGGRVISVRSRIYIELDRCGGIREVKDLWDGSRGGVVVDFLKRMAAKGANRFVDVPWKDAQ